MKKVGLIGWRGMVGSVLLERMGEEKDFETFKAHFFTTSQKGMPAPQTGFSQHPHLQDAFALSSLSEMDIIVCCQGSDYTNQIWPQLKNIGWQGYWIDASSAMRMDTDSVICLDPINGHIIKSALDDGIKKFIGGNCTVSLLLLALGGLIRHGVVEWISSMTYQAASGGGAKHMKELLQQMNRLGQEGVSHHKESEQESILAIDRRVTQVMQGDRFETQQFGVPLAGSLIPWIDTAAETGQTREEWKAEAEGNKILQVSPRVPIDGICVRVGAMRSHSQGFTIKLTQDMPISTIEEIIASSNDWVHVVPNEPEATKKHLTPAAVSGTLSIPVGRIRKMSIGPEYITAFSVGDQLLWGAAEPLRRMLRLVITHLDSSADYVNSNTVQKEEKC